MRTRSLTYSLIFTLLFLVMLGQTSAQAEGLVICGLRPGMTEDQVRKLGVHLIPMQKEGTRFQVYGALELPVQATFVQEYELLFDKELGLCKLRISGEEITDDQYGHKVKQQFKELQEPLWKKYGLADEHRGMFKTGNFARSEFYECLNHRDCGVLADVFNYEGMTVVMEVVPTGHGRGYIRIDYQFPNFDQAKELSRADDLKINSQAL